MACLSKNGPEMLRLEKIEEDAGDPDVSWRRSELSFCATRHDVWQVLTKNTVRFRPTASWDPPGGRLHTWGWKLGAKVEANAVDALVAARLSRGWRLARDNRHYIPPTEVGTVLEEKD